eukprot:m.73386 g.73386  ORF g.73386 m.73386 type:complete len:333 (+) comp14454_c0_seq2:195-1193(+)
MGVITMLKDLFPTKGTFIIFVGYMALFVNLGLLVTATKQAGPDGSSSLPYNPIVVVFLTEFVKLVSSIALYLNEGHSVDDLIKAISNNRKVFLLYFVPATLYALYNVLAYINLVHYDPTTYFLLLQLRVVVTGVVYQILFQQQLSGMQWLSLVILMIGCIIKQTDFSRLAIKLDASALLILVQVFCSCFAGVYNEYLLKGHSGEVHTMVQNVFMYTDSMIANALFLGYKGELGQLTDAASWSTIFQVLVICLIVNNAAMGIVTSLFLKHLNSLLKTFASALELFFTAIFAWILFGIPLDTKTFVAMSFVSVAIYIYAHKPVKLVTAAPAEKV